MNDFPAKGFKYITQKHKIRSRRGVVDKRYAL